jgi:hypothetical protein
MYVSDCQNVYSSDSEGYMDQPTACQNCQPVQTGSAYYTSQGYTLGGSCSQATNNQDGQGYQSDGVNYYVEPQPTGIDSLDALDACQNPNPPSNPFSGLQQVGTCGANTQENFTLFPKDDKMKMLLVLLLLLIVGACVYYYYIRKRKTVSSFEFEFF